MKQRLTLFCSMDLFIAHVRSTGQEQVRIINYFQEYENALKRQGQQYEAAGFSSRIKQQPSTTGSLVSGLGLS